MILYKYMKAVHAVELVQSKRIYLAKASSFNDPFEYNACLTYDPKDPQTYLWGKHGVLKAYCDDSSYLYCMTRRPDNSLMWAHYADAHAGVVVGIDVDDDFFQSEAQCIIPAKYGNVIYTNTKPFDDYPLPDFENNGWVFEGFQVSYLEAYQRIYLHKSVEWAYEEEVRVVKPKKSLAALEPIYMPTRKAISVAIPSLKVKQIYIGCSTQECCISDLMRLCGSEIEVRRLKPSSRHWGLVHD